MSDKFWETQPAKLSNDKMGAVEKPETNEIKTNLPDNFTFKNVTDISALVKFINEFYIEGNELMLNYSEKTFEKLFSMSKHKEEYSIGLFYQDEMVGYVFGKEHKISIYDKIENILSVNFLCLKPEFRRQNLAPLLIKEIKRVAYSNKIYSALFSGDQNRGFAFTEVTYYHLPLNVEKLKKQIYLPHKYADKEYKFRKETKLVDSCAFIKSLNDFNKRMQIYEVFDQNTDEFDHKDSFFYTLQNEKENEFVSFYVLETKDVRNNQKIKKAVLYYWAGSKNILEDAFAYAKDMGVDMFDVINCGRNEVEVLEHFDFLMGTGRMFYHLFNYAVTKTGRSRVNFILF